MDELTDYEKMIEGVHKMADVVGAYVAALIEKGFTREEAIRIAIEYQNTIIRKAKTDSDERRI